MLTKAKLLIHKCLLISTCEQNGMKLRTQAYDDETNSEMQ